MLPCPAVTDPPYRMHPMILPNPSDASAFCGPSVLASPPHPPSDLSAVPRRSAVSAPPYRRRADARNRHIRGAEGAARPEEATGGSGGHGAGGHTGRGGPEGTATPPHAERAPQEKTPHNPRAAGACRRQERNQIPPGCWAGVTVRTLGPIGYIRTPRCPSFSAFLRPSFLWGRERPAAHGTLSRHH
jgi:hypothetical protein